MLARRVAHGKTHDARRCARGGGAFLPLPADHHLHDALRCGLRHGHGAHLAAVAEHGEAVRDARQLLQAVRNIDDGDAPFGQPPHECQEGIHLVRRERAGGLVEDENLRLEGHRLGDLHHLPLGHAETAHDLAGVQRDPHHVQRLLRPRDRALEVDHGHPEAAAPRPTAQEDVLRYRQSHDEAHFLVDGGNTGRKGVRGAADGGRFAFQGQGAAVRVCRAAEDLHERRLARSILPDERAYLAGGKREIHPVQRLDARVMLANLVGLQERHGRCHHFIPTPCNVHMEPFCTGCVRGTALHRHTPCARPSSCREITVPSCTFAQRPGPRARRKRWGPRRRSRPSCR